ncbi:MAG: DUF423 domain-containing protein [Planctomycetes bacterium]|nr:DUF423 domain-containing protein [Planctomycetota bacterium]
MNWIAAGAVSGAITVALGALGAHGLKDTLGVDGLDLWRTAAHYQGLHALALVVFGLDAARRPAGKLVGWCFLLGSLCFSGSIYGLALGGPGAILGPITPLGGVLFIVGWLAWAVGALRAPTQHS